MLQNLKILELATYIAAPSAGGLLSDWGASVVKIESPQGCPMRTAFETKEGFSPVFDMDNRGKRSLCLDITKPEAITIIKKLLARHDVFLTNVRSKSLHKVGIGYEQLKAEFPQLIYAELSGYGTIGPDKDLPGFDISAFFARSGLTAAGTPKTSDPVSPRIAVGDHTAGLATAAAILAAVLNRQQTNKGCFIDASLLRTGIYALGSDLSTQLGFGRLGSAKPRNQVRDPMNNFFRTKDERWLVLVPRPQLDKEWVKLCGALGLDAMASDEQYKTPQLRRETCAEIVKIFDDCFAQKTLTEWSKILDDIDFIWAPVMSPAEVIEDPQANAMEAFVELPAGGGGGARKSVAGPVRFIDVPPTPLGAVRNLGEDNDAILKELGFGEEELSSLKEKKVLG